MHSLSTVDNKNRKKEIDQNYDYEPLKRSVFNKMINRTCVTFKYNLKTRANHNNSMLFLLFSKRAIKLILHVYQTSMVF